MDAIKEYLRAVDRLEHSEINLGEYEELCKPLRDVRENVKGEWVKMDKRGNNIRCSKCGNTLDLRGVNAGRGDANYCPNCGADMRPRTEKIYAPKEDFEVGE